MIEKRDLRIGDDNNEGILARRQLPLILRKEINIFYKKCFYKNPTSEL